MKRSNLILLFVLVAGLFSSCQERPLKHNGSVILSSTIKELNLRDYLQVYEGDITYNGNTLPNFHAELWNKLPHNDLGFGLFAPERWVKVKFLANEQFARSLYIDCVLIPEIDIYLKSNKQKDAVIFTGSTRNRKVLSHQIEQGYAVDWQFQPGEVLECYIRFDCKGWASQPIIKLFDAFHLYNDYTERSHYLFAFRLSVFIILVVVISLFVLSKRDSFIYYALMMLGAIAYVEINMGLFQRFFDVDEYYLSYMLRNIFNVVYYYFIFMFIKSNLETDGEDWLNAKKIIKYFLYLQAIMFVVVIFFNPTSRFIPSLNSGIAGIITATVLAYLIFFMGYKSIKGIVRAPYFLVIYFISFNVVMLVVALPHIGLLPRLYDQFNIICAIFFIEFMIFLVVTIVDAWKIILERNRLLEEHKAKERSVAFALISGQEIERNRIGRELHDAIGGNLASAKHKINDQPYLQKILNETIHLVRDMSHGLVIPSITGRTFKSEIEDLAIRFSNEEMKVRTIFHQWPDQLRDDNLNHLYRISQELLQNASKHSRARQVFLQFLGGAQFQLSYEDNGMGFDQNENHDGLGWKNIHFRVQTMSAKIKIESSHLAGTTIVISNLNLQRSDL